MSESRKRISGFTFTLATAGTDVHCVANQLLEREIRNRNYPVTNLGVALSPKEICDSLYQVPNPFVLLGTLNGDIDPAIHSVRLIREEHGRWIPIVVGGNLVLGENGRDRSLDLLSEGADLVMKNVPSVEEVVDRTVDFIASKHLLKMTD